MAEAVAEQATAAAAEATAATTLTGQKRARADDAAPPTAPIADDLALPLQAIMRIVKSRLPDGFMVGAETKKAFGKICSLFILYLSTIAADVAKENNRTTVSAADVLAAMRDLEFDEFLLPVEAALAAFRETEKAKSIEAAAKRAAAQARSGEAATESAADAADGDAQQQADEADQ